MESGGKVCGSSLHGWAGFCFCSVGVVNFCEGAECCAVAASFVEEFVTFLGSGDEVSEGGGLVGVDHTGAVGLCKLGVDLLEKHSKHAVKVVEHVLSFGDVEVELDDTFEIHQLHSQLHS